jgi:hypothetical protein
MTPLSPAGSALSFGSSVTPSVDQETEEERKKRLAAIAQSQARLGLTSPAGNALGLGGGYGIGGT